MALFAGKQENRIDAKNRVSLPVFIRSELPDPKQFHISPNEAASEAVQTAISLSLDAGNEAGGKGVDGNLARAYRLIYLYPSPVRDGVIEGCDRLYLEDMRSKILAMPRLLEAREYLTDIFFANATALLMDDNGRIQMPDELKAHAGLNGNCFFVGRNDVFEIWHKDKYEAQNNSRFTPDANRAMQAFADLQGATGDHNKA